MVSYYVDYGNELNPDLVPTPSLCLVCKKWDDPHKEIFCTLTRFDQGEEGEFVCYAFEQINEKQEVK